MRGHGLTLMAFNRAMFSRPAAGAVAFGGEFDGLPKSTVLASWHTVHSTPTVFKDNGGISAS